MENTQDAKIIESSELLYAKSKKLSQAKQSEFILSKKSYKISCATPLPLARCSHDDFLKFQHNHSMCHHRRKSYKMRQGQCNRLPILCLEQFNRIPRNISFDQMFNRSNRRIAPLTVNAVTMTKMWHV